MEVIMEHQAAELVPTVIINGHSNNKNDNGNQVDELTTPTSTVVRTKVSEQRFL